MFAQASLVHSLCPRTDSVTLATSAPFHIFDLLAGENTSRPGGTTTLAAGVEKQETRPQLGVSADLTKDKGHMIRLTSFYRGHIRRTDGHRGVYIVPYFKAVQEQLEG